MTPLVKSPTRLRLITAGAVLLVSLCAFLYFTSDHHKLRAAVQRARKKDYSASIAALERLSPKRRSSEKAAYLRHFCQYGLALESYGFRKYRQALDHLASIPKTYPEYEDVLELQTRIEEKQQILAEQLARDVEDKKKNAEAVRQREEEKARKQAEDLRLYGAELDARINYTDGQLRIANFNSYDWVDVDLQMNPGLLSKGYFLNVQRIEAGAVYTVGVMQFANKKGERFNPFALKPRKFTIVAHKPNGDVDAQSYEWQ